MGGEEEQEGNDKPCHAQRPVEQEVVSPEPSAAQQLQRADDGRQQQQQNHGLDGSKRETGLLRQGRRGVDDCSSCNEVFPLPRRFGKALLEAEGRELLHVVPDRTVGLHAQQQVDAERRPGIGRIVAVEDRAQADGVRAGHAHGHVQRLIDDVAGLGAAVVVEEVVAVRAFLGTAVLRQQVPEPRSLVGRQRQLLLGHRRAALGVLRLEALVRLGTHDVVRLPQAEAPDEMRCSKVEQPVVEHHVHVALRVLETDGRVPVQLPHLGARAARQQAHTRHVRRAQRVRRQAVSRRLRRQAVRHAILLRADSQCQAEKQGKKNVSLHIG